MADPVRSILPLALVALVLAGCQHAPAKTPPPDRATLVEVGTVTAHGVHATKKALAHAGIPAYTEGSDYPLPYRILVPAEYRERAVAVLRQLEQEPGSAGYGITHL